MVYAEASKDTAKGLEEVIVSEGIMALISEVDSSLIFFAFIFSSRFYV